MRSHSSTLVVLPAFNEEQSIEFVLNEIHEVLPDVDVLVVDDGSSDGTTEVAKKMGVTVATLPFNLGVGGAMRLGFKYALIKGYQNVVQIDADGQHDPREVPKMLGLLGNYDIVIGARFAGSESYSIKGPRRWAMWILSQSISKLAKTTLTDTTSGFKANGPKAIKLFASNFPAEYLGDTIEALVIASKSGCRIIQVPTAMRERKAGQPSHNPFKAALYLARAVFALFFALMKPSQIDGA